MIQQRKITCIVCPLGCRMTVRIQNAKIMDITGNSCRRGASYAIEEITDPRRTLTTTMRVKGGNIPLVSVKTDVPVPKGLLLECMQRINKTAVNAPIHIGDVLIPHIAGAEANIVATVAVSCYNDCDETNGQRDDSKQRAAPSQQQMAAV